MSNYPEKETNKQLYWNHYRLCSNWKGSCPPMMVRLMLGNVFLQRSTYTGERNIYYDIYELHILSAIAVAVVIRIFVCPEVEIVFECESSKYSEWEIDYWWAISSIAPNGVAFDSKAKYKKYWLVWKRAKLMQLAKLLFLWKKNLKKEVQHHKL